MYMNLHSFKLWLYCIVALQLSLLWTSPPAHSEEFIKSPPCISNDIIGCNAFNSSENITMMNDVGVGGPNNPKENKNCKWNGGTSNCFPVYDKGTCANLDLTAQTLQRSQDSFEAAQLWSPCYDETKNAARLTFWNDLKRGIQQIKAIEADANFGSAQFWTQYEIRLSPEFFFAPKSTTSGKLYRIYRNKTDTNCTDERFADHRFLKIKPDQVKIGPVLYCAGIGYAGSEAAFTLDPTRANHWIRITAHYDIANSSVHFWGYDITTNQLISDKFVNTHTGKILKFTDPEMKIKGLDFTLHSSSHQVATQEEIDSELYPSPHFWIKNVALSTSEIAPYPDSRPEEPELCTSYNYSPWEACQSNNIQARSITSAAPLNCAGGEKPTLTQLCNSNGSAPSPPILKIL